MGEVTLEKAESVGVKHEYIELTVEELSVVDRPANQKEFAVIKCVESDTEKGVEPMADQTVESTARVEAANVEVVPVEVAKNEDDSAMTQALEQLDTITKSVAALGAQVATEEGGEKPEVETTEKAAKETPTTVFQAALKANGVKGEALTTAMKKYEKVCACGAAPVAKADESEAVTDDDTDGNEFMGQLATAVNKAKVLTPKRLAALKALQEQLAKMIGEMEGIPHSKSPKTKVPKNNSFGASGLSPIMKGIEAVTKSIGDLGARIEKIEKTRQGSKTLGETGTATPTQKADGEFWSGAI